jgi:hypothetical protein
VNAKNRDIKGLLKAQRAFSLIIKDWYFVLKIVQTYCRKSDAKFKIKLGKEFTMTVEDIQ